MCCSHCSGLYRGLLENELIPAIMTKWPRGFNRTICIQQDGAKVHIPEDDTWFAESLAEMKEAIGLEAKLYTQPAKERLERLGQLPVVLEVTNQAAVVWGEEQND